MNVVVAKSLFPTTGRLSEALQIGRDDLITVVESRLERGDNTLLFGPRRIGKSSIGAAAIARLRNKGALVVDVDIAGGVRDSQILTSRILSEVLGGGVHLSTIHAGLANAKGKLGKAGATAANVLSTLSKAGVEDVPTEVADHLAKMAQATGPTSLVDALGLLEKAAEHRPVIVFLDEVGLIVAWDEVDEVAEALAACMRKRAGVTFLFAGSHQRAAEELFGADRPLYEEGLPVTITDISQIAWEKELPARFATAGCEIEAAALTTLLDESKGHPQDTMRLASCCLDYAPAVGNRVDGTTVELALRDATKHPTWGKR